ncbi:copper chaperone PCu(A)C [Luteimonas sp. RC10]|uniref:copper chaperone PCu(A)C n=1 Tax=Luteimonas sp. RC10 TaxID=2587035 RepID=UPI00161B10DA|nr:copper chaperone PCu(A)C [Luteimonas sp. RC10]MBB3343109.1 copper(I)-binding protein [Luteimonas sp. RC10]
MRHPRFGLLAVGLTALTLAACQPSSPDAATPASATGTAQVTVSDPWIRETPPNAAVAGGYLTLRSAADDRLVSVESAAAAAVEIHEMRHDGGMMRMRELPDGVPLAAGTDVELRPGGYHLMFIDPVEPLRAGATVEATLHFEHAPAQQVQFDVRPLAGDAAAEGHSGH